MGIITAISTVLGLPVLANGIALITNNAVNIGTFLTIALGVILILFGLFFKLIKKLFIYPLFKLATAVIGFLCIAAIIASAFLFVYGKADTATYKEDYLVVLGCGLNGSEPSQMLIARLDKATQYANRNTDCKIIVSGGQGKGEDIPEAHAMAAYLTDKGISADRIIIEDKSTSTTENFKFSNRVTDGALASRTAVFITNDFHIYRANSLAKRQGLSLNHLNAPTTPANIIPSYLRENLALVQMILLNK